MGVIVAAAGGVSSVTELCGRAVYKQTNKEVNIWSW